MRYPEPQVGTVSGPPWQSLAHALDEHAQRSPDRTALLHPRGSISFASLALRAGCVGERILDHCSEDAPTVAILLNDPAEQICALLGAFKAGKIAVFINADYPEDVQRFTLEDSGAGCIITDASLSELGAKLAGESVPLVPMPGPGESSRGNGFNLARADDPATIVYTSGSTGKPKGVLLPHKAFINNALSFAGSYGVTSTDRYATYYPFGYVGALMTLSYALVTGIPLLWFNLRECADIDAFFREQKITLTSFIVSSFRTYISQLDGKQACPSLRGLTLSGELVMRNDLDLFREHFSPDCQLHLLYASSETLRLCENVIRADDVHADGILPTGKPCSGHRILILDPQGEPLPAGRQGEIAVVGDYLALGYWNQPERTGQAFVAPPEGMAGRMFLTGDLGTFDDTGTLTIEGRRDSMIKIRGHQVNPGRVEQIIGSLETVKEIAVTHGRDVLDRTFLAAYFTTPDQEPADIPALRRRLSTLLRPFEIPVFMVHMQRMPLTTSGKIDRISLPDPSRDRPELPHPPAPAETATERELVRMFESILTIRPVGIHDDFFQLGGDSLLMVTLFAAIEREWGLTLSMEEVLRSPCISSLALTIDRETGRDAPTGAQTGAQAAGPPREEASMGMRLRRLLLRSHPATLYHLRRFLLALPLVWKCRFRRINAEYRQLLEDVGWGERMQPMARRLARCMAGPNIRNAYVIRREQRRPGSMITTHGREQLQRALAMGKGVVLTSIHSHSMGLIGFWLRNLGHEDAIAIGATGLSWLLGSERRETDPMEVFRPDSRWTTCQLYDCMRGLADRRIVTILGDGDIGNGGLTLPFLNSSRPFRYGLAELSLSTDSPILPLSIRLDDHDRLHFHILPPFDHPGRDMAHDERLACILTQYRDFLEEEWRARPEAAYPPYIRRYARNEWRPS